MRTAEPLPVSEPIEQPSFFSPVRCGAFAAGMAVLLAFLLTIPAFTSRHSLRQGDVAVTTIKSPVYVPPFPSTTLTEERKRRVADSVPDVLVLDPGALAREVSAATDLFRWLDLVRQSSGSAGGTPQPQGKAALLSPQTLSNVASLSNAEWQDVQQETLNLLTLGLSERIAPDQLPSARAQAVQRINPAFRREQADVVSDLLFALLEPNLVVDQAATDRVKKAAAENVPPVLVTIAAGETLVRDGQIITAQDIEKLAAAGLLDRGFQASHLLGTLLLALALSGLLGLFVYAIRPPSLVSHHRLGLLALVLLGTVAIACLALPGRAAWPVAFPVSGMAMVLTTLRGLPVAIMGVLYVGLAVAYVADLSPQLLAYAPQSPLDSLEKVTLYCATGLIAAVLVARARRTVQYFAAGGAAALAGVVIITAFWLLSLNQDLVLLGWELAGVLGGGLLGVALAMTGIAGLGMAFGITTRIQLQELAQSDHPLLKQLLQEAPGTYYHSILVSNLAEQACEAIGADALLARVGAYYHDIGKVANPGFFIENQRGENIHDRLDPLTSASLIIAHVRDGLRLAHEARVPSQVQAFIEAHHGSRLATSFYNAATHLNPNVNPELFRYPGPRPRTRETGVVMLADSVEAVARSAQVHTPEELSKLVDRVVAERIAEGQLDQCPLTLQDIERVKTTFKSALRGIYHPRITYPAPAPAVMYPPASGAARTS